MIRKLSSCILLFFILFYSILPNNLPSVHAQADDVIVNNAIANNDFPILLVHGFGGWGRDEMFSFKYWGGLGDIQETLRKRGHSVYTAAVGTVSSNWDRACELYAQIKGGTVDYGRAHSELYGHERYGRSYEGLYPSWGEIDPNTGRPKQIHVIGHSMGGQTSRMLIHLLEKGDASERAVTAASDLSPLFSDQPLPYVSSLVSLAAPHDGTSFTHFVEGVIPFIHQLIGLIAAASGNAEHPLYDFKLDQWGLKRMPDDSFFDYFQRVINSKFWRISKDSSLWDLSPDGAKQFNEQIQANPSVYYFSIATNKSYRTPLSGWHAPKLLMNPLLLPPSYFVGSFAYDSPGHVVIDEEWWPNDGLVNTISMDGPKNGSNDQIITYQGKPQIGKWNYLGLMDSWDHLDIVGLGLKNTDYFFLDLADMLTELPPAG
ncbi:lipase [Paenibacillus sp. E194]|uniref:esterase/lipase family protein n=1 Tax=Paenibacillus sp. E194 TaxID=1458845 RepID=UPI0005C9946D|nr:lipase [Paenibacillus sp. E194]KJB88437.1 lipase [Paenibacillus sp. E194]